MDESQPPKPCTACFTPKTEATKPMESEKGANTSLYVILI